MALSEPFSIGPEQGEVHRNGGLLIVRQPRVYQASFSSRRWWGGPRRLSYSYPPVLLLLITPLALMAHVPALLVWLAAGWYAFYRALHLARPGQGALLLALAAPGGFHQRGRRTEQHLDGGAVRRRLEPARATAAARRRIARTADLQAAARAADPGCVGCGAALARRQQGCRGLLR
jgi:hypothetical protein